MSFRWLLWEEIVFGLNLMLIHFMQPYWCSKVNNLKLCVHVLWG